MLDYNKNKIYNKRKKGKIENVVLLTRKALLSIKNYKRISRFI